MTVKNSGLDRLIDAMFAVAFLGVAWLTIMGHRGLAPSVAFMALAVIIRRKFWRAAMSSLSLRGLRDRPLAIAALAGGAFCVWIAATGFWSPTPGAIWLAITVFAAFAASCALNFEALNASVRRASYFGALFSAAVAVAALALLFEGLSGGYLRDVTPPVDTTPLRWKDFISLGRGATAMAPLIFPAAVLISRIADWRAFGGFFVFILFVASSQYSIFTNNAAILAGSIAALAAMARPKTTTLSVAALTIFCLIFTPFMLAAVGAFYNAGELPSSWAQRVVIWNETSVTALNACMPFGCGADYARAIAGAARVIGEPGAAFGLPIMPTHPHNAFLQIWLELGLPGVITLAIAICGVTASILRAKPDGMASAAICGAAAAILTSLMTEASLWQAWRLSVFCLAAFGAVVAYRRNKARSCNI